MKMLYISPLFLDGNGTITLTVSQLAALGCDESVISEWDAFWEENGGEFPEGFDVSDTSTWAKYNFNLADVDTWFNPLFAEEE